MKYIDQVVSKFSGDGAVVVLQHATAFPTRNAPLTPNMLTARLLYKGPVAAHEKLSSVIHIKTNDTETSILFRA